MSDIYDRSPIPDSTTSQRRAAVRAVCALAVDASDCQQLLDQLGLTVAEGLREDQT